jgi:hypothetical protein
MYQVVLRCISAKFAEILIAMSITYNIEIKPIDASNVFTYVMSNLRFRD